MRLDEFKAHTRAWLDEVKAELPSPSHMHPIVYIETEWDRLLSKLYVRLHAADRPAPPVPVYTTFKQEYPDAQPPTTNAPRADPQAPKVSPP